MVNLDVREFKVVKEALKWVCDDDPANPNCFALQLVTKGGEDVSHSVRLLPGREELYQSDETVFPGPPRWLEETEVMPRYLIPKTVIDSLEGVEFLRKIGARLPESMRRRVVDLDLYPRFEMKIMQGLTAAETEHLVIDIAALEKKERRSEKLVKGGWELVEQKPVRGKQLLRFAREKLYPVPDLLAELSGDGAPAEIGRGGGLGRLGDDELCADAVPAQPHARQPVGRLWAAAGAAGLALDAGDRLCGDGADAIADPPVPRADRGGRDGSDLRHSERLYRRHNAAL